MPARGLIALCALMLVATQASAALINNQLNQPWVSFRDLTSAEFSTRYNSQRAAGYRMIDIDAYPNGSGVLYSQVWEKNADTRAWAENRDMTGAQFGARWTALGQQGYRLADFESYRVGSNQRYAGIWVKNTENWTWSSRRDMTSAQYATYFSQQRALGRRPIDLDVYQTAGGLRYAAIWYQNVGNVPWVQLRDMTLATFQVQVAQRALSGHRVIDAESYTIGTTQHYAAIWERNPAGRSHEMRYNLTELQFANLWRLHRDQGYRLVEYQRYPTAGGHRHAGVWVENDLRFDYPRRGALDTLISNYRIDSKTRGIGPINGLKLFSLQGISVAVIHNGQMIYRRGFGHADVNDGELAHAETVYNMASVAKVIGGTLAGKLEAERRLRDGTTFSLDMRLPTKHYLSNFKAGGIGLPFSIPAHHTHNVDQLLSHLACVGHYDTKPAIANQTTHRATALAAVRSIWGIGLVQTGPNVPLGPCIVGSSLPSYSTPAFTFVGAVLERQTGRTVSRLLREQIAIPYGLPSLRAQYETATLPANYERAAPYTDSNVETTYEDNSWKILSGGMESNAVDLATFGWKVLNGQIVSPTVRDNRVFAPVSPLCILNPLSTSGLCAYGLGWGRGYDGSRRIVAHGGSWTGAESFILMYREQGLVIAILSNRRGHDPSRLALAIGCAVLSTNFSACPSPP